MNCFQTTYEELKLFRSHGKLHKLISFQTTYEELKQDIHFWIAVSGFASRLPMRNWNVTSSEFIITLFASRLPMRNWNKNVSQSFVSPEWMLPDYLWGIETGRYRHYSLGFHNVDSFQTTYEELKLPPPSVNSHILPQLPDYLWGIETGRYRHYSLGFHNVDSFQTTYEELKHLSISFFISSSVSFQTTYEELKPKNPSSPFHQRTCFQTTYEELKLPSKNILKV